MEAYQNLCCHMLQAHNALVLLGMHSPASRGGEAISKAC